MSEKEKAIRNLKLHEILYINDSYEVMKVHNGFIYTITGSHGRQSSVFVPNVSNRLNKRISLGLRK